MRTFLPDPTLRVMWQTSKIFVQSHSFPPELICCEVLNHLTFVLVKFRILQEAPITSPRAPWSFYWPQRDLLYLPKGLYLLVSADAFSISSPWMSFSHWLLVQRTRSKWYRFNIAGCDKTVWRELMASRPASAEMANPTSWEELNLVLSDSHLEKGWCLLPVES